MIEQTHRLKKCGKNGRQPHFCFEAQCSVSKLKIKTVTASCLELDKNWYSVQIPPQTLDNTTLFIPDASSHLNLASVAFPRRSPTSCFGGSSSSARFFIGVKMASRLYIANITFQHFERHMYSSLSFYILHFTSSSFLPGGWQAWNG